MLGFVPPPDLRMTKDALAVWHVTLVGVSETHPNVSSAGTMAMLGFVPHPNLRTTKDSLVVRRVGIRRTE